MWVSNDTQLILDGVTLFDQHLVDKLTYVNYDDGFSLEHTNRACLGRGRRCGGQHLQRHLRRLEDNDWRGQCATYDLGRLGLHPL